MGSTEAGSQRNLHTVGFDNISIRIHFDLRQRAIPE